MSGLYVEDAVDEAHEQGGQALANGHFVVFLYEQRSTVGFLEWAYSVVGFPEYL